MTGRDREKEEDIAREKDPEIDKRKEIDQEVKRENIDSAPALESKSVLKIDREMIVITIETKEETKIKSDKTNMSDGENKRNYIILFRHFRFDSPPKSDESDMSDDPEKMDKLNKMKAEK